jgi:hypothetical protein
VIVNVGNCQLAEVHSRLTKEGYDSKHINLCSPLAFMQKTSKKSIVTSRLIDNFNDANLYFLPDDLNHSINMPEADFFIFNLFHESPIVYYNPSGRYVMHIQGGMRSPPPPHIKYIEITHKKIRLKHTSYMNRFYKMVLKAASVQSCKKIITIKRISPQFSYSQSYYYLDRWAEIYKNFSTKAYTDLEKIQQCAFIDMNDIVSEYCLLHDKKLYEVAPYLHFELKENTVNIFTDMEHFSPGIFHLLTEKIIAVMRDEPSEYTTTTKERDRFIADRHDKPFLKIQRVEELFSSQDPIDCGLAMASLFYMLPNDHSNIIFNHCKNIPANVRMLTMLRYYNKIVNNPIFKHITQIHQERIEIDLADKPEWFKNHYRSMTQSICAK